MEPFFFFLMINYLRPLYEWKLCLSRANSQIVKKETSWYMIKALDFWDPMDEGLPCLVVNPALYENTIDTHVNISIDKLAMGSYILLFLSIIYTQNSSQDTDSLYIKRKSETW